MLPSVCGLRLCSQSSTGAALQLTYLRCLELHPWFHFFPCNSAVPKSLPDLDYMLKKNREVVLSNCSVPNSFLSFLFSSFPIRLMGRKISGVHTNCLVPVLLGWGNGQVGSMTKIIIIMDRDTTWMQLKQYNWKLRCCLKPSIKCTFAYLFFH